jgi:hypothetical protein
MTPLYVLGWAAREGDLRTLEEAVQWAAYALWKTPNRCSAEGKALLNNKLQEWWSTSELAGELIWFLAQWAKENGNGSSEHREVVRITILCVRTEPNLSDSDRLVLDLLDDWSAWNTDQRNKAKYFAFLDSVKNVAQFAQDHIYNPWHAIYDVVESLSMANQEVDYDKAEVEHERHLADLIRSAMPVPPVVV